MRLRQSAALIAAAATSVLGLPVAAHAAAAGGTLYVDNSSASCADAGGGAADRPYCTISAAAAAVQPGQTVLVKDGGAHYRESVRVTRSGTRELPITFLGLTAPTGGKSAVAPDAEVSAFELTGVHDVVVRNFATARYAPPGTAPLVSVTDSSRITLDRFWFGTGAPGVPAVRISGAGDHVTVGRSYFSTGSGGVSVAAGARSSLITGNDFNHAATASVTATDAPDTAITYNTIGFSCGESVRIDGASPGAVVENNVITAQHAGAIHPPGSGPADAVCTTAANGRGETEISVSAGSTSGSKVDFNTVHPWPDASAYTWGGASYPTAAAFAAAQPGQATHDVDLDATFDLTLDSFSYERLTDADRSAVDSADPAAPGLDTDLVGMGPLDDPDVPNTAPGGALRDRGAYELTGQRKVTLAVTGNRASQGPAPFEVTATATVVNTWGTPQTDYTFDFGDGTAPVHSTSPTVGHVYQQPGMYYATVTATDAHGVQVSAESQGTYVTEPGDLTLSFGVQTDLDLNATVIADARSPWRIYSYEYDYGDGNARTSAFTHHYAAPGSYTVTVTATDEGGRTVSSSRQVEMKLRDPLTELQPGERVQLVSSVGPQVVDAGANYTSRYWSKPRSLPLNQAVGVNDWVKSVATAVGSDQIQRTFTLINGRIFGLDRNVGPSTGSVGQGELTWPYWYEVTAATQAGPLSGVTRIAVATIGSSTHVVALAGGRVYEASGSPSHGWSRWGDITAAVGFPGGVTAIAAGTTGNTLHVAMEGADWHIRVADGDYDRGRWSGADMSAAYGGPLGADQLAAATTPGSRFHVVALRGGRIYEITGDYAAGYWTGWGDISAATGRADFSRIAAGATGNSLRLFAIASNGNVLNATGDYTAGRWSDFAAVNVLNATPATGPGIADEIGAVGF
ncbi:hypothetical protein GCM10010441_16400 [Kitasatospora paracochleata]|uniref:PKD repeat protein n=1 Tax=Kitasatospora paracochleata TaxID=58354 RepID=A0ABT1IZB9_9ACTN|nr:PKD domain-containing protein [Kitasatospora paracochleata]MCP2310497.1 PKD repeat protein [Kitasatospora paracochleata]